MKKLSDVLDDHQGPQDWDEQIAGLTATTKKRAIAQGLLKILERRGEVDGVEAILDIGGSRGHAMYDCCPCLTKTRTGDCAFFGVSSADAP